MSRFANPRSYFSAKRDQMHHAWMGGASAAAASATTFYVATDGSSSGDGSAASPWDLQTALDGGPNGTEVRPGDRIEVAGGTYGDGTTTYTATLTGELRDGVHSPKGKIQVYPAAGETAVIDGFLSVTGSYTWYRELTVTCSQASPPNTHAVTDAGTGNKFLDLINHDSGGNAFSAFASSTDVEFAGCISYFTGRQTATGGAAHSWYLQNDAPSTKWVRGCVGFLGFGYGLHFYADAGSLDNIIADRDFLFNYRDTGSSTAIAGGAADITGMELTNLFLLEDDGGATFAVGLDYDFGGANTVTIEDCLITGQCDLNNFVGGSFQRNELADTAAWNIKLVDYEAGGSDAVVWDNNTYWNLSRPDIAFRQYTGTTLDLNGTFSDWQSATGRDTNSTLTEDDPTGTRVLTYASPYVRDFGGGEIPVGWVGVKDFGSATSVDVDLSDAGLAVGDDYKLYHVFDLIAGEAATLTGTYAGGTVAVPLEAKAPPTPVSTPSGTVPATIGDKHVFRVVKT